MLRTTHRTSQSTATTRTRGPTGPGAAPPQCLRGALLRGQERAGRGLDLRQCGARRLVRRAVQQRRRQPGDDPPKHVRTQEHRGHPVRKSAQRGCHPAGRHRRGERETQVVRPALADQAAARLPLREPRRDPAPGRGVARVPESQRRPDRVPRRVPVARVPATAERARRGRSGADLDPRRSPVRLLPDRGAIHGRRSRTGPWNCGCACTGSRWTRRPGTSFALSGQATSSG